MLPRTHSLMQTSRLTFTTLSKSASLRLSHPIPRQALLRVYARSLHTSQTWCKDYPPHQVITMPALSPTMTQGSIGPWRKSSGEAVNPGDVLVEIETDKAMMEFEAQEEGFLAKVLKLEGEKDIQVGTPIAVIADDEGDVKAFEDFVGEEGAAAAAAPSAQAEPAAAEEQAQEQESQGAASAAPVSQTQAQGTGRKFASPAARKEAESRGIDISSVKATGITEFTNQPRVVLADVKAHQPSAAAAAPRAAAPAPPMAALPVAPGATYEDIELSNMRRIIAQRLMESKNTAPHYTVAMSINMSEITKWVLFSPNPSPFWASLAN